MTLKENLLGLLIGRGAKLPDNATDEQLFSAIANDDADGDGHDAATLARKAFQASAKADSKETHIAAGAAHHVAAEAYDKDAAGDFEKIHSQVAKFHTCVAAKCK